MRYKKKHKPQSTKKAQTQNSFQFVLSAHTNNKEFFDSLWQKGEYEELERILKAQKQEISGILVENLSKLAFFQPEKKLTGSVPAFVSHILTGGACLIARNPIYHHDIAEEICGLANEIKLVFKQLKIKNKQTLWDQSLFELFVDYEANILTQVLQLAVKSHEPILDFIPTPSYLWIYNAANKQAGQHFLRWLGLENEMLFQLYDANTYHAAFWALSGEKLSDINSILKSVHKYPFHPYLRLALMLRSSNMKKPLLTEIVQISDIENLKEPTSLFKNIAIQAVKFMISQDSKTKLFSTFWKMLIDFYPVLDDPEVKNSLVTKFIDTLHKEREIGRSLDIKLIKKVAKQINADEFENQLDTLAFRQQACKQFLATLLDEKKSKKSIANIKDKETLYAHLTLIVDSCCLLYSDLSKVFFWHISSLAKNKRLNKLIPLEELIDHRLECDCSECQECLYQYCLPRMGEELNLPVVRLPDCPDYSHSEQSKGKMAQSSVLSQTDPFKILDVSFADSKPMIMQKVMKFIQQSPGQMAIFRQAQSELFNPAQKFLHHYFRYFAYENSPVEVDVQSHCSSLKAPLDETCMA